MERIERFDAPTRSILSEKLNPLVVNSRLRAASNPKLGVGSPESVPRLSEARGKGHLCPVLGAPTYAFLRSEGWRECLADRRVQLQRVSPKRGVEDEGRRGDDRELLVGFRAVPTRLA